VIAATQAIGQLGYQAKREALRLAGLAGNQGLVKAIGEQMQRLPDSYATAPGEKFGSLLEKVERGMDTVISRIQQVNVSGAKVGFSVDGGLGTSLGAAPTAGTSNQVGVDNATGRNAQAFAADQLAAQTQANRINSQLAAQARAQGQGQSQQPKPAARSSTVGRQSLQAAQTAKAQPRPATTTAPVSPSSAPLRSAQQQASARQAMSAQLAHAHEQEEQQHKLQLQQQQQQTQRATQQKAAKAAAKIDPNMLKGFQSATSLKGVTGNGDLLKPGRPIDPKSVRAGTYKPTQATTQPPKTEEEKRQNTNAVQPPAPLPPRGGGRGF
jgi:hypothetical protein